jgi:hypothetical protein
MFSQPSEFNNGHAVQKYGASDHRRPLSRAADGLRFLLGVQGRFYWVKAFTMPRYCPLCGAAHADARDEKGLGIRG